MAFPRRILIVTQVYPPDPTAVGQYLAEVAEALVSMGHQVCVLTSNRGYDDPSVVFPRREIRVGVEVVRLPLTSFGKGSIGARMLGGSVLVVQAILRGLRDSRIDTVLATTTPHLGGAVGVVLNALKGVRFHFWLMDINPDQTVQLGRIRPDSLLVKLFDGLNRQILSRTKAIYALDGAMAERFQSKLADSKAVEVVPLWPLKESRQPTPAGIASFIAEHGLSNYRVVMHSGNHSLAHPLDTLFSVVKSRGSASRTKFLFVGGGVAKKPIEDWVNAEAPGHVLCLPYQPIERLGDVLGAATVQVVVVGPQTVGIVHPSKLYSALAAGKPILVIGPKASPAAQLVTKEQLGWHVEHGDESGLAAILDEIETITDEELEVMGSRASLLAAGPYSREVLLGRLVDSLVGRDA